MPTQENKEGDLRVWWIPQIPGKPFKFPVTTPEEARMLLKALGLYDIFQFENNIKPDFCNAGGLEVYEDGEWLEWDDQDGYDINGK